MMQNACIKGAKLEQEVKDLRGRIERLEISRESYDEKLWQELAAMRREMVSMREEFSKETINTSTMFTKHIADLRVEFSKITSQRIPPWVTGVTGVLCAIVGVLGGLVGILLTQ